ncbi:capsular polysaccharide biosynthesis protein [Weissella uvarum]|uniref:YveK family protein n=1 Tax=Weissella uvarum TaxID=1479233 RepID=UPI00195F3C27|nr:Wzz/FepE/Etk N-terminal domain-containing protein [Weissella uvarum]MBM7617695.1 capsular polysaccharide biosynthesis protein [Weissella uvarum]MCM0596044.1 capsular biosynthesis protein [Weissella uvarum]
MENVIDLRHIWQIIKQNLVLMLTLGVLFAGVGFAVSKFVIEPQYASSVNLLVNRKDKQSQDGAAQYQNQQADVQMINTYKDIINQPVILDQVSNNLSDKFTKHQLQNLTDKISISNQQNSQVFEVSVKTGNPYLSRDIANEIAKVFKSKITKIMDTPSNLTIVSKASAHKTPVSPKIPLITLISFVLGVLVAFAWGMLRDMSDRTIKSVDYITQKLGLTNLGMVGYAEHVRSVDDVLKAQEKGLNQPTPSRRRRV